jgi:hypothetical protein
MKECLKKKKITVFTEKNGDLPTCMRDTPGQIKELSTTRVTLRQLDVGGKGKTLLFLGF